MAYNYTSTFLGVNYCTKCKNMSVFNVIPEKATILSLFVLLGIPFTRTKKFVVCSHCGAKYKLKGEFLDKYKQALRNNFDEESVVERFINEIEETCIEYDVVSNGMIIEPNLEKAADKIYDNFSFQQGYNRDFYLLLCQIFALQADYKLTKYNLMFRT